MLSSVIEFNDVVEITDPNGRLGTILSLDLGLDQTGVCLYRPQTRAVEHGFLRAPPQLGTSLRRLDWFYKELRLLIGRATLVAIEGYSYNSRARQHTIGELGGVARLACIHQGVKLIEIPPGSWKLVSCGYGQIKKHKKAHLNPTINTLLENFGVECKNENEGDALGIAITGAYWLARNRLDLSKPQAKSLAKISLEYAGGVRRRVRKNS